MFKYNLCKHSGNMLRYGSSSDSGEASGNMLGYDSGKVSGSDLGKKLGTTSDNSPGKHLGKNSGKEVGQDKTCMTGTFLCFGVNPS
jgi:hypothetical protein